MDKEFLTKVKKLNEITNIGITVSFKTLKENNGDIEKAIECLKKQGMAKNIDFYSKEKPKEGVVKSFCDDKNAVIFEINCQTDFAAQSDVFCKLVNEFGKKSLQENSIKNLKQAQELFLSLSSLAVIAIKEPLILSRFEKISKKDNEVFGYYNHIASNKIASIVIMEKDEKLANKIAAQIASRKTEYICFDDVDKKMLENKKKEIFDNLKNDDKFSSKPEELLNKIADIKARKEISDFVLYDQFFLYDETKKVSNFLEKNKVIKFIRYEICQK